MKSIKNIYPTLTFDRIKQIIILASKGKSKRREVRNVLQHIDYYTYQIKDMLCNHTYYMKPSHHKTIFEKGKKRELTVSPFFPNRILDYIIVECLKPYIKKSMYEYCIGNVNKRGMIYGKNIIARKYKRYKYYLQLDIYHFYPQTTSKKLLEFIEPQIKDEEFLKLVKCVISSSDDLPIGSYYSQWFSNWFLQDLDHFIKEQLRIEFYIRYVDDMILMSNNKRKLLNAMYSINRFLNNKGLRLKRLEQVKEVKNKPIDFLGFRFCENKIVLRTRNFKKLNKKLKKIRRFKNICISQARSLMSYLGWLKQIKLGWLYYKKHILDTISLGQLRRLISNYAR